MGKNKNRKKQENKEKEKIVEEDEKEIEEVGEVKIKKKSNFILTLINIMAILVFVFVLFETIIAFLNFNQIKNEQEPSYFITKKEESDDTYDYKVYNMRLYRIVRKDEKPGVGSGKYEIRLYPFFLDYHK